MASRGCKRPITFRRELRSLSRPGPLRSSSPVSSADSGSVRSWSTRTRYGSRHTDRTRSDGRDALELCVSRHRAPRRKGQSFNYSFGALRWWREQREQLFARERLQGPRVVGRNHVVQKLTLPRDDLVDPLLERPLGHELEDLDDASLTDPVNAVGRLVFPRGVPPTGVVDDDRASDQVDPRATRLEAPDEDPAGRILVEARYGPAAVARLTSQFRVIDTERAE